VAVGLATWLAFTIVTVFYLLMAGLLVLVGYRRLKGLTGMKRTRRSLRGLAGPEEAEEELPERIPTAPRPAAPAPPPYTGPTAGQVGAHRESVSDAG
jgi:hypothetical protein